jgi:leader peptidase (prepilin peptidase)/N-methyltransferase
MGLVVGSYLNVVIHRLPLGLSTVRPASRCPSCGTKLRIRDNIPIISFLVLRGRCRSCGERISWRYPSVEAATGALFFACVLRFGASGQALASAILGCLLIALALIDLDHFILPDRITLPGVVVGLVLQPLLPATSFRQAGIGIAVGAGIILLLDAIWWLLRRVQGFGLGDAKMLAMVGAFLGWRGVALTLFLGALTGSIVGVYFVSRGKAVMQSKLPFGTFLSMGALVAMFVGPQLIDWYLSLY